MKRPRAAFCCIGINLASTNDRHSLLRLLLEVNGDEEVPMGGEPRREVRRPDVPEFFSLGGTWLSGSTQFLRYSTFKIQGNSFNPVKPERHSAISKMVGLKALNVNAFSSLLHQKLRRALLNDKL